MEPQGEDARYLEGIRLFNAREFFDAHEVWEDLWHEMAGPERRFVQGLIQAAVCAYHAINGNIKGANRLFESARRYMNLFAPTHRGLDVSRFWIQMEAALVEFQADPNSGNARFYPDRLPVIELVAEKVDPPVLPVSTHKA